METIFTLYAFAAASVAAVIHYEDNLLYAEHQRISDFTSVNEMLWVRQQNIGLDHAPSTTCQAMLKLRYTGRNTFQYIVYSARPPARHTVDAFVTTLTTGITALRAGDRLYHNTISYKTTEQGEICQFKLMYADKTNGCFIFVTPRRIRRRGCRLVQTSRTVSMPIPQECNRVYTENCLGEAKQIYYPACWNRIPKIVQWGS
uniref:Putative secreted protein n=1 Tax=Amblyomma triste TaxID=251400 RepID=A0A023GAM3_AMBTT